MKGPALFDAACATVTLHLIAQGIMTPPRYKQRDPECNRKLTPACKSPQSLLVFLPTSSTDNPNPDDSRGCAEIAAALASLRAFLAGVSE